MYLFIILSILLATFILFKFTFSNNTKPIINKPNNKQFLQSPEYRCSTKCFDCVKEQTFNHLNPSHGNPKISVGL